MNSFFFYPFGVLKRINAEQQGCRRTRGPVLWPHILVKAVLKSESPSSYSPLQLSSPTHQVPSKCPSHKSPSAGLRQHRRYRLGADEQQDALGSIVPGCRSPLRALTILCGALLMRAHFQALDPNSEEVLHTSVVPELGQPSINPLRDTGPTDVGRGVRKLLPSAEGYGPTPGPAGEPGEHPASAPARVQQ